MKKILHISHHEGCFSDLKHLFPRIGISIENFGKIKEYNITEKIANDYWNKYKDYFNSFDLIITSDTSALSRIFIREDFNKKLLIWVCNRFDSFFGKENEGKNKEEIFPDKKFYELFKYLFETSIENIRIIPFCKFEYYYIKEKFGIEPISDLYITPSGLSANEPIINTFCGEGDVFLFPRHNEKCFSLDKSLSSYNIKYHFGRYNVPRDLEKFKCAIHIPYSISTLTAFEFWNIGLPILVPSVSLLQKLATDNNFWIHCLHRDIEHFSLSKILKYIHFYEKKNESFYIYYDSFDEIKDIIQDISILNWNKRIISEYYNDEFLPSVINKWTLILKDLEIL